MSSQMGLTVTHTVKGKNSVNGILNELDKRTKNNGAVNTTIDMGGYVLSLPTASKPTGLYLQQQTNSATQLVSKMKATERLQRKLEERRNKKN